MAVLVVVQVNTSVPSVAEVLKRLGLAHWMMLIIMSTPRNFCAQIIVTRSIVVRARASSSIFLLDRPVQSFLESQPRQLHLFNTELRMRSVTVWCNQLVASSWGCSENRVWTMS
jgi:hypothetical protein